MVREVAVDEDQDQLEGLSHSLTGLTSLLSEMSGKVLAQGEMVDRIDVNTKVAYDFTCRANQVLSETKEILENGCAARLQRWLLLLNLLLFVCLVIKFK